MFSPGASFCEWLAGTYWRLDSPADERPIALALEARARDLRDLLRGGAWRLSGTIDAEGLAAGRPVEGTVCFGRLREGQVRYRMAFVGEDGRPYELTGHKEWSGFAPLGSMTLLFAKVHDGAGEEVARATLRFDLRSDWVRFLKNVRLRARDG